MKITIGNKQDNRCEKTENHLVPQTKIAETSRELKEIVSLRGRKSKVFDCGDGKILASYYGQPKHYRVDNTYQEIDNTFVEQDGVYETKANIFKTKFYKHPQNGKIFEMQQGEYKVGLISLDAASKNDCEIEKLDEAGNESVKVKLCSVRENTDLEYIVMPMRVKENIIIREKSEKYEYEFELPIENLMIGVSGDGKRLELQKEKNGNPLFYIPSPVMYDAKGVRSEAAYYEIVQDDERSVRLKVVADAAWINDDKRVFPVVIDPQIALSEMSLYSYDTYEREFTGLMGYYDKGYADSLLYYVSYMSHGSRGYHVYHENIGYPYDGDMRVYDYFDEDGEEVHADFKIVVVRDQIPERYLENLVGAKLILKVQEAQMCGESYLSIDGEMIYPYAGESYEIDITERLLSGQAEIEIPVVDNHDRGGCGDTNVTFYTPVLEIEFTKAPAALEIVVPPLRTVYSEGEPFDRTGMEVRVDNGDGSFTTVTDYTISPSGLLTGDCTYVTVMYENLSIRQPITVISGIGRKEVPAREKFSCSGGLGGSFDLSTGEIQLSFADIEAGSTVLPLSVGHAYKLSASEFGCGKNWRLNLHQTLQKRTEETGTDTAELSEYIYTDAGGTSYTFDEVYYYLNNDDEKVVVPKDAVSVDQSGNLTAETDGETFAVTRELSSPLGLVLSTRLEGVKNAEKLEQRAEEVAELEETVRQLREAIDECEYNIGQYKDKQTSVGYFNVKEKYTGRPLSGLFSSSFDSLFSGSSFSNKDSILSKFSMNNYIGVSGESIEDRMTAVSEAIQRLSVMTEEEIKQAIDTVEELKDKTTDSNGNDVLSANDRSRGQAMSAMRQQLLRVLTAYQIELTEQYNNSKAGDSAEINKKSNEERRKEREEAVYEQTLAQKERYSTQLAQKEAELALYKAQVPVSYLKSENGRTLCFNEEGNLCAVADNYENAVMLEWDTIQTSEGAKQVVTAVYDGDHKSELRYNRKGRLSSVNAADGKRVRYYYTLDGELSTVKYSDGRTLNFAYAGGLLSAVTSSDGSKTTFSYTDGKLTAIETYSRGKEITSDTTEENAGTTYYQTDKTEIGYREGTAEIATTDSHEQVYMDSYGRAAARLVRSGAPKSETEEERAPLTFAYLNADKKWGYRLEERSDLAPLYQSAESLANKETSVATIAAASLPQGETEYLFGGEGKIVTEGITELPGTGMAFETSFRSQTTGNAVQYGLRAVVRYSEGGNETFFGSFDYRTLKAQYLALPVTLDRTRLDKVTGIDLYVVESNLGAAAEFGNLRFAAAAWEYTEYDEFRHASERKTSESLLHYADGTGTYEQDTTKYVYDENKRLVKERTEKRIRGGAEAVHYAVKKYSYCEHGNLVKTESYVEGEEGTSGVNVTEKVCDDKGNIVKEFSYNTLDSGTKFYTASDYAEDGTETATYDETGENKTTLEYADGTTTVKTQVLPNGSKFSYGHDAIGRVTAITQSTKEGESNQTTKKYNLNCVTHLTSGKNVVQYEYDHKRRVKKVLVNGTETAYAYAGSAYDDTESVTYEGKAADKMTVTRGTVEAVSYTDKRGNALGAVVGGETQYKNTYNADDKLQKSVDEVTGSETVYTYATDGTKRLTQVSVSAGTNVNALTESYAYNDHGQTATKSLTGGVNQAYGYFYKDNAARDLDYMTLPNGLQYHPQKDVNGRNTGKELTDGNGNRKYGEYIYYRKVGDHATNMPASVYYGMTTDGKYVIGENVKYSYDEMGNISKVFENGTMSVRYTYDALNRLVREDNKKLGKTYFTAYDNCGNILSKRETAYTLKAEEEITAEVEEILYGYEANSDRLTAYNGAAIAYDAFGNPTNYKGNTLTWKYGKFLSQYGSTAFAYDGYGKRIKKGNTVFTYDSEGNLIKQSDGTNTLEFIYDGNGLCGVKYDGTEYLYRKNAQGDITHILDNAGMVVAKYIYDAWGNHAIVDASGNNVTSGIGVLNPFRYRGYFYDEETDLYYLQTRYYDPETGRFISQDDVSYLDPDSINGLNLYAYCGNNPVNYLDPNGNAEWWQWLIFGIGVAVVAAAAIVLTTVTGGAAATFIGAVAIGAAKGALIGAAVGSVVGIAGGVIYAGVTGANMGDSILSGFLMGFGIGAVVGAVIGGFAGANGWYNAKALEFTNVGTKNVVLGRSPRYVEIAQSQNATYFHTTDEIWNATKAMKGVGNKGMWRINKAFLRQQIKAGANFILTEQSSGFFYAKEIAYVMKHTIRYIFL